MKFELQRGNLLRLGAGKSVTAHTGYLWITEQDGLRDVILQPGQTFRLARPGLALIEAFTDASVSLSH
jgi:hypothetical protein